MCSCLLGELPDFARRKGEKDPISFPWINENKDKLRSTDNTLWLLYPLSSVIGLTEQLEGRCGRHGDHCPAVTFSWGKGLPLEERMHSGEKSLGSFPLPLTMWEMPSASFPPSTNDVCEMLTVCNPSVLPFQLDPRWHFILGSSPGSMSLPIVYYHPAGWLSLPVSWMSKRAQSSFCPRWHSGESGFKPELNVQLCHRVDPALSHVEVHCTLVSHTTVKCVYVHGLIIERLIWSYQMCLLGSFWL